MVTLKEYEKYVGADVLYELELYAAKLKGVSIQNINSTAVGGGVAEILNRMIPLLHQLGVNASWDVIKGGERFFEVTKKMHNALHGKAEIFTKEETDLYLETNEMNANVLDNDADIYFIHDPQPCALIRNKKKKDSWIWRCHIDFSNPDLFTWDYLKQFIEQYDVGIFSAPSFARNLKIPQVLISPSIDPLSNKNKELPQETIDSVLEKFNIDKKRPIVTQISRFDYLKDPVGVVKVFRQVKKYIDCQLVLAGGGATDDPEGSQVLAEVQAIAENDPDIFLLLLPPASDIEINALQRASTVVLQKSLREGFGLTVAEALWKSKPVIAGAVGGIPLQISHKYSGLLTHTIEGTAFALKQLLQNPEYAKKLGENGRELIRKNFLITRHLRDYLLLFLSLLNKKEDIVYL
ncbi:MAG: glycosyl transferase family 1 [Stygiobacter sp. RIFOXYC12_FULL_38_8]|nr:MAG: glycosyl transferase family 1 [Stygiobacter sp. GWC2_38_9]OGU84369.1 MAG: glycosyl transferase family 1 [Stygiobacter sp. RIFOXYA12_FULL_38_9]OGV09751.1 MAG: glycosyl transferase family 1 [Stygiobacter sp. RIFOXYB2_FULL_37_11]OGV13619.1 MAG: glycosyl transferase family 1 [Stygiobacter sp. RIFOXYC2_FULL_38_25]OGV16123.1 MAG: glycosyl transferase family 1 [Stygiobacter sp. RIFOXYA2_FULL_38_8]OGV27384.1 MAG: glycosyl transferase family 1 [Stygiobacter sp. RIFOXYC12_FULL_38_8]OGV80003.1 M